MSKQIITRSFFNRTRTIGFRFLITAFVIIGLAASAWAWFRATGKGGPMTTVSKEEIDASVSAQSDSTGGRVESEIITITPRGFEPAEITRPAGQFLLAVHNRSGLEEVDLRIDMESGVRVREDRLPLDKPRWRRMLSVPPGRYVITEANHPDWVCHVAITAP